MQHGPCVVFEHAGDRAWYWSSGCVKQGPCVVVEHAGDRAW
jgi:hypothetical protein